MIRLSEVVSDRIGGIRGSAPTNEEAEQVLSTIRVHDDIMNGAREILESAPSLEKVGDNAHVLRRANGPERLAFYTMSALANWDSFQARRGLKAELDDRESAYGDLKIDRGAGAHVAPPPTWTVLQNAVAEAAASFENKLSDSVNPGKETMRAAQLNTPMFSSNVWSYGTDPGVLKIVSDYLGVYPVLLRINLLLSANDRLQENSSQFPHLDPEDFQQMKIFLYVNDVDEDTGPFQVMRADASDRVQIKYNYRFGRLSDDQLYDVAAKDDLIVCTGEAGTANFADTSRGFHFGSRPSPKPRKLIMYQYVTPFAASWAMDAKTINGKYSGVGAGLAAAKKAPLTTADEYLLGIRR